MSEITREMRKRLRRKIRAEAERWKREGRAFGFEITQRYATLVLIVPTDAEMAVRRLGVKTW